MHDRRRCRLTLRDAIDEQFGPSLTWLEWVWWTGREFGVDLTEAAIDELLWEQTAFPVAGTDHVKAQVVEQLSRREATR